MSKETVESSMFAYALLTIKGLIDNSFSGPLEQSYNKLELKKYTFAMFFYAISTFFPSGT